LTPPDETSSAREAPRCRGSQTGARKIKRLPPGSMLSIMLRARASLMTGCAARSPKLQRWRTDPPLLPRNQLAHHIPRQSLSIGGCSSASTMEIPSSANLQGTHGILVGCGRCGGMSQENSRRFPARRGTLAVLDAEHKRPLRCGIVKFGRRSANCWAATDGRRFGSFESSGGRPTRPGHIRRGCDLFRPVPTSHVLLEGFPPSLPPSGVRGVFRRGNFARCKRHQIPVLSEEVGGSMGPGRSMHLVPSPAMPLKTRLAMTGPTDA
jgi:hypothetical protein